MTKSLSFTFKDVFNNLEDFTTWYNARIGTQPEIPMDNYVRFAYYSLARAYNNVDCMYSTPGEFLDDFENVLNDELMRFTQECKIIARVNEITTDEMLILNKAINNTALNKNTAVTDPTQPLKYINSQVYTQVNDNKLRAYMDAINNLPSVRVGAFVSKFAWLFTRIYGRTKYYLEEE